MFIHTSLPSAKLIELSVLEKIKVISLLFFSFGKLVMHLLLAFGTSIAIYNIHNSAMGTGFTNNL